MRLLHCISTREFAGTERHLLDLAGHQAREHDVTVLIGRDTRDARTGLDLGEMLPEGVRVLRAGRLGYAASLALAARRLRPDVIHAHLGRAGLRARLLAGRIPTVATLHNRFAPIPYGGHDALICVASWQRDTIPERLHPRTHVIGNWTRLGPPDPARGARLRAALRVGEGVSLIGAAGRLVPEKGFDVLLAAFAAARGEMPGARLVLFGAGPEETRLRAMASPDVIFAGHRPDLAEEMTGLDAFVLPSRREPFGLVLIEAMRAGLPVLATEAGGVLDILPEGLAGRAACLVPPGDVAALAAALPGVARAGRRVWDMQRFSLPARAAEIDAVYRDVCAQRRQ